MATRAQIRVALKARRYGARYSLRIVLEAHRAGIPVSLGFALVQQESNFQNVFGHDPTIYVGAGKVTRAKYLAYKKARGTRRMQGVGPCQLTWWATQDAADHLGGCWKPACNIRVGFQILADSIKRYGVHAGIARYNGSGAAARRYAAQVVHKRDVWHRRLA